MSRAAATAAAADADIAHNLARFVLLDQSKCIPGMPAHDYLRKLAGERECEQLCIRVSSDNQCSVLDDVCQGCLNKARRCPGGAVRIVHLPHQLASAVTYRYGPNAFKLHRMPAPRAGQVLGLVGTNGIGKSTALRILAGQLKPNLGRVSEAEPPAEWDEVIAHFRGGELQAFLTRLLDHGMHAATKLQLVDLLARHLPTQVNQPGEVHLTLTLSKPSPHAYPHPNPNQRVSELLGAKDERGVLEVVSSALDLGVIGGRQLRDLNGVRVRVRIRVKVS